MIVRDVDDGRTASTAVYSDCERYRYALSRCWATGGWLAFVLLNPSTASERTNDPTVARCERRARALGFGGLAVVNLFGWRATDPRRLAAAEDPVGPDNDAAIDRAVRRAQAVICGWGVRGGWRGRGAAVEARLRASGRPLCHLGLTRDGAPRHPLYLPAARGPEPWLQA